MNTNELGMNNEFERLRIKRDFFKGRCAEELETYMTLITVGGENIQTRYMIEIGGLEHRACELRVEALRWRRRLELCRAAEARGERPDFVAIEESVETELAKYQLELEERRKEVRAAKLRIASENMDDKEVADIRYGYLQAAKKLHPDLAPNLPRQAASLWLKIQEAYREKDWREVKFLIGLVDGVIAGSGAPPECANGVEAMQAEVVRLDAKLRELVSKRLELMKTKPYCWEAFLDDEDGVAHRKAVLRREIGEYEESIADAEAEWNGMREVA